MISIITIFCFLKTIYISYLTFTALLDLEIFTFLFGIFGYVEERPDMKAKVNLKIYDVKDWTTYNCNKYIVQYLKK